MTKKNLPSSKNGVFRYQLKNGSVLLVKEDNSTPVVSLNLWVEAGSIDERPDERGMAHLIEHMIFKGTPKRGVGEIFVKLKPRVDILMPLPALNTPVFMLSFQVNKSKKHLRLNLTLF